MPPKPKGKREPAKKAPPKPKGKAKAAAEAKAAPRRSKRDREEEGEEEETGMPPPAAAQTPEEKATTVLVRAFERAQQSISSHQSQQRLLLDLLRANAAMAVPLMQTLLRKSFTLAMTPDSLRRFASFLGDVAKAWLQDCKADDATVALLQVAIAHHNAKDRNVRLAATTLVEPLLCALDQKVDTEERAAIHDGVVFAMKHRLQDTYAPVRERAAAALGRYHTGKPEDDLTQLLIAASCEDSAPGVRRQVAASSVQRTAYFRPCMRMARDVSAAVRRAAWEKLGKLPLSRVAAYATRIFHLDISRHIAWGLRDAVPYVPLTVRAALQRWLSEDCGNNPVDMLALIGISPTEAAANRTVAEELLRLHTKLRRGEAASKFPLQVEDLTPANVLMWQCACRGLVTSDAALVEAEQLPPLGQFNQVIMDVMKAFTTVEGNDPYTGRVVHLADASHAAVILRMLLDAFTVYDDGGYLTDCDDTARAALVRTLQQLLRVVLEDDPGLFVPQVMVAVGALTRRQADDTRAMVHNVLTTLWRNLRLPQEDDLGFDDLEAFGQRDAIRRQQLRQRPDEELQATVADDTLYLQRMQHVTLEYVSCLDRGGHVPDFCAHTMRLGRAQCDPTVRALATKALGVHCLIAPGAVHTFLPLLLEDAKAAGADCAPWRHAAVMALFDVFHEYGPAFFDDARTGPALHAEAAPADEAAEAARRREVQTAMADAGAKYGGERLLMTLRRFLLDADPATRRIAAAGHMKLLAANRVPPVAVADTVALLCYVATAAEPKSTTAARRMADPAGAHTVEAWSYFMASFASSSAARLESVADGAMLALRVVLARGEPDAVTAPAAASLVTRLVNCSDAAFLQPVRAVDPDFVANAAQQRHEEEAADTGVATAEDEVSVVSSRRRSTGSSIHGTGRLQRELARYSRHEQLARDILVEIVALEQNPGSQKICAAVLPRLKLYRRLPAELLELQELAEKAEAAVVDPSVATLVRRFAEDVRRGAADLDQSTATLDASVAPDGRPSAAAPGLDVLLGRRDAAVEAMTGCLGPLLRPQ